MILKLFVANLELRDLYRQLATEQEKKNATMFPDSGIDLYAPSTLVCRSDKVNKVDFEVQCSAFLPEVGRYTGYYLYPRSSISKTPLRLANSVGIIDAGYRGHIMAMMDCCQKEEFVIQKGERYAQICAPDLRPIQLIVVDSLEELSEETQRGQGGFGSTGH